MRWRPGWHLRGVKDWSPTSDAGDWAAGERPPRPWEGGRSSRSRRFGGGISIPGAGNPTTWKTVAAVAIVGVVVLAVLNETGIIRLVSWK